MPEISLTYTFDKGIVSVTSKVQDIKIKRQENGDAIVEFPDANEACCVVIDKANIS